MAETKPDEKMVTVSMLGNHAFRPGKGQPTYHYNAGINEMPLSHAKGMGLMDRIVQVTVREEVGEAEVAFEGRFDQKLTDILVAAGYETLGDLARAGRADLMAVDGVGPSAYEKIQLAIHGETSA